ncbi:MAG: CAP domain-containing protein [Rhodobacterales bacterium]
MLRTALTILALMVLPASQVSASADAYVNHALNAQRAAHGLHAVQPHHLLMAAAEAHARDMARNGFMSHRGSDGSSVAQRVRRQGFCYRHVNENIAMGFRDPAQVMTGWYNSPGHRRNALSRNVTHYGFAAVERSWVLVMGRPC